MTLFYIYCIWVKTENGVLRYYGHTENMRVRKDKHVSSHKTWVAAGKPKRLYDAGKGITRSVYVLEHEDWRMDVVDKVEHEDKKEALTKANAKEGEWILKYDCVNMYVAGRTIQETLKHYEETHKEERKEYRETHKEKRNEYAKQYNEQHKEERKEYAMQYRETHKAEISEKQKEKVTCDVCNAVVTKGAIAKHRKSKKHHDAVAAQ